MSEKLTIAVLEGTVRDKRRSIAAARFVAEIGRRIDDVDVVFVDPKDFTFPSEGSGQDNKDPRYSDITANADGFFIVTPEYNHSFPGTLKRMLDSEFGNYHRKPVALAGVSDGQWGGTRAVENLLPCLRTLQLVITSFTTYFPYVQNIFDEQGNIRPEHAEKYTKRVHSQWEELLWYARILRQGRANT